MKYKAQFEETEKWKKKLQKKPSFMTRYAKNTQTQINRMIPERVHTVVTESIKKMVEITLKGHDWIKANKVEFKEELIEREALMGKRLDFYKKTAILEGAGTGAGGFFIGLADFPLLLSIKMKFLAECSLIHGYDVSNYEERLFMLYVFQLAFSSEDRRNDVLHIIENWNNQSEDLIKMDWKVFQQEYRDYMDLAKMFQLLPGIGAVVGAFVNKQLLEHLGGVAKHAYRIRFLNEQVDLKEDNS